MQFSVSVAVNVDTKRGRSMASEWIRSRYEDYKDKRMKLKQKEVLRGNALSAAPALFQRLKGQVLEDVHGYNAVFGQVAADQHCCATLEEINLRAFAVSVQDSTVRISIQEGTTVICAEYSER